MNTRRRTRGRQAAVATEGRFENVVKPWTELSDYVDVARLIIAEPPIWLAGTLRLWSVRVWPRARVHDLQPLRARMRAYLWWFDRCK